jgi:hypothetical protein
MRILNDAAAASEDAADIDAALTAGGITKGYLRTASQKALGTTPG